MTDHSEHSADFNLAAGTLASCLRNCMRAVAVQDPTGQSLDASRDFVAVVKILVRNDHMSPRALFADAIGQLRTDDHDLGLEAAKAGLRWLIEKSCTDGLSEPRTSQRQRDFQRAIDHLGAS